MKIVIIGSGKVGSNLSHSLTKEKHDITIIDCNSNALKKIQDTQDVMCIVGNGADVETQLQASVDKSGILIATTHHDELNLLCCLIAKRLGAERTISRVRNPLYYKQIDLIKDDLRLSMIINPEDTTANEIFRVLAFPPAVKVETFANGRVELVEHKLTERSTIVNTSLADIYKHTKIKCLICAVERDGKIYIPSGDFVLKANDKINVTATHKDLEKFFKVSNNSQAKTKVKNMMIVGGGRLCYYLTKKLLAVGMRVKIFEIDLERCKELAETFPNATIINGDGTDQELLMEEGLDQVDGFASLTGIDEENIIMSLYAKNNSNAKVITKINRDSYSQITAQLGLDCVVAPKNLTVSNILSYVRSLDTTNSKIEALYHIVGNQVEAIEFKVTNPIEDLTGIPLKDVKLKKNILICGIIRKRDLIIPDGRSIISLGDTVIVICKDYHFSDLEDILE